MNFRNALTGGSANWTIDRPKVKTTKKYPSKVIIEKIPDVVAQMVVTKVLSLVGESDWNDPFEVLNTIAKIMSIDLTKQIEGQYATPFDMDRTILVPATRNSDCPHWTCQSIIRVDKENRYINYKGSKYNIFDIILESKYFKEQMHKVATAAHSTWNVRWANAKEEGHRLYQKTRTGSSSGGESWLDRCVKPLLTDKDVKGIKITDLIMIEWKRDMSL
jgi:hypothetical protein